MPASIEAFREFFALRQVEIESRSLLLCSLLGPKKEVCVVSMIIELWDQGKTSESGRSMRKGMGMWRREEVVVVTKSILENFSHIH